MRKLFCLLVLSITFTQISAQGPPNPCGPASILSEALANNVAEDSRCFELRFYTAEPAVNGKGGIDDLHQRFREKQITLLEQHGADMIAHWQRLDNPNTVVWLLAFRDREHRDEVFATFRAFLLISIAVAIHLILSLIIEIIIQPDPVPTSNNFFEE